MLAQLLTAALALQPHLPPRRHLRPNRVAPHAPATRTTQLHMEEDVYQPTLREQMLAYKKMVEEKGMVLSPDQQKALEALEKDEANLGKSGLVDFNAQAPAAGPTDAQRAAAAAALQDDVDGGGPAVELDPSTGMPIKTPGPAAYGSSDYGLGDRPPNHRAAEFAPAAAAVPSPPPAVAPPPTAYNKAPTVAGAMYGGGRQPDPEPQGVGFASIDRSEGVHGTGFRFMPMSAFSTEPSPLILPIAGAYPGLTAAQLQSPTALPHPEPGRWNYHRLVAEGLPGGFVALPGTELLESAPNAVAVVCSSKSLGVELSDNQEHEVLALIDRGDVATSNPAELDPQAFYALADEAGAVHIRWVDALPAGWSVLGKLLYAQLPCTKRRGSGGGFAEMNDDFEF